MCLRSLSLNILRAAIAFFPGRSDLWAEHTDLGEDLVPFCEITGVSKSLSPIPSLPTPLGDGETAHRWARCPDQILSL